MKKIQDILAIFIIISSLSLLITYFILKEKIVSMGIMIIMLLLIITDSKISK